MKTLSNKQLEIMQIIWEAGTSLTTAQICRGTELSEKKVRKTLDRLQRKGYVGITYLTYFCGMSQVYYPIIKEDDYLRYCMERLQELTGKSKSGIGSIMVVADRH